MRLFTTLILLCSYLQLSAQEHFYDFIHLGQNSDPAFFYSNDRFMLFTANAPGTGKELYVSDGTEAGTQLLYDFSPGSGNSSFTHAVEHGKYTFFLVYADGNDASIWYTDGTTAGTKKYYQSKYNYEIDLGTFNNYLFYQDQSADNSYDVRRVDSSLNHDTLVASHSHGYQYAKSNFVSTDNYLFYGFNDQMYRVDKTFASPEKYFERSATGAGDIAYLYAHKNTVIWYMRTTGLKTTVYAGKEAIGSHKEVETLYNYIYFRDHAATGNYFYYCTPQLHRLNVNTLTQEEVGSTSEPYVGQSVNDLALFNGQIYFSGITSGDFELWKTGNSNATTVKVKDIASDTSSHPQDFYIMGNTMFFSAYTREAGRELWQTDGSAAKTTLVTDLVAGARSSYMGNHGTIFKNKLYTSAHTDSFGVELWQTDGTAKNTQMVSNINTTIDYGDQRVSTFMKAGDYLYLMANDSTHNVELWRTDGTHDGTIFLDDLNPDRLPGAMGEYVEFKGKLYGTAVSFLDGVELYRSAGTPASSFFVTPSDLFNSSAPRDYAILGHQLYYVASEGFLSGSTLFISDGSKDGTKPLNKGKGKSYKDVSNLAKVGDKLFFSAEINSTGREPFISDGSFKGTTQISDISSTGSSEPNFFCGNDTMVFFSAMDDNGAYGIYQTNPSDADPEANLAIEFKTSGLADDFEPDTLFMHEGNLFFSAFDDKYGKKFFRYQPSSQAVNIVSHPTETIRDPSNFVQLGDKILFTARSGNFGEELIVTDGSMDSTYMLKDINANYRSAEIDHLTLYNGLLFFKATSVDHGSELWMSDGTKNGTKLLWDINPGTASSEIRDIAGYKGQLYIAATEGVRSGSLYRMVVDSCHALAPELRSTDGQNVFCEGSSVDLKVSTGIFSDAQILWYKDNVKIDGASATTLNVTEAGNYMAIAKRGSCALPTETIEIEAKKAPIASIEFDGDSVFCLGKKTVIKLVSDDAVDVQWYKDGAPFATTSQIGSDVEAEYYFTATNSFGCSTTSGTVSTEVLPLPKPSISLISDTLWCDLDLDNYQWFFKGVAIAGGNEKFWVPTEEGAYRIDVVNQKGCEGSSEPYKYERIGIEENLLSKLMYPNPTNGALYLKYPGEVKHIRVFNLKGEILIKESKFSGSLDLSGFKDGVYFIQVQTESATLQAKVIKMGS